MAIDTKKIIFDIYYQLSSDSFSSNVEYRKKYEISVNTSLFLAPHSNLIVFYNVCINYQSHTKLCKT